MRQRFFYRFASERTRAGLIRFTIRFFPRGSGTGVLRKPSDRSGIRVFPRRCCPAMGGTHPLGLRDRIFSIPFQPTRLGEYPSKQYSHCLFKMDSIIFIRLAKYFLCALCFSVVKTL